ncbi:MAG: hypothetical protein JJ902_15310 [Roseibium sp.]|nr:hypothetical protein [Roseibium sp.]
MPARIGPVLVLLAALGGCTALSGPGGQTGGYGSSFGAGASLADVEASTAIKVLVNNEFGKSLEPSDRRAAAEAQRRALRARGVGAAVAWQNDRTGKSGQVRPGPLYQVNDTTCREFTHELTIDGQVLRARGTACRQENGSWQTLT